MAPVHKGLCRQMRYATLAHLSRTPPTGHDPTMFHIREAWLG